jgi:hypothetical protein
MNLEVVRDEIKTTSPLSNSAKLLAGYMKATGLFEAKALAEALAIPLRTIQRLKLEIACANDAADGVYSECGASANHAISAKDGAATCANSAVHGVSDAPTTPPVAPPARVEETNLLHYQDTSVENKNPPTPRKRGKPAVSKLEVLEAFHAYNATAERCALPQAAKLTPDRERKIAARLKDYGLEGWHQALANVEKSSFLTGTNDRGWRASLDYLMEPKGFAKTHDGVHGNGRHAVVKTASKFVWNPPTAEELRAINA